MKIGFVDTLEGDDDGLYLTLSKLWSNIHLRICKPVHWNVKRVEERFSEKLGISTLSFYATLTRY